MGVREKKLHSWIKESWNYQGKVVLIHIPFVLGYEYYLKLQLL